jgi:hypothetical protein
MDNIRDLIQGSLDRARQEYHQKTAAAHDQSERPVDDVLASRTEKLASAYDELARRGIRVFDKAAMDHPDSGTGNPDTHPDTDDDRSTDVAQAKKTVPANKHTAQKGTETQPGTDEDRDVDTANPVAAVLKQSSEETSEEAPAEAVTEKEVIADDASFDKEARKGKYSRRRAARRQAASEAALDAVTPKAVGAPKEMIRHPAGSLAGGTPSMKRGLLRKAAVPAAVVAGLGVVGAGIAAALGGEKEAQADDGDLSKLANNPEFQATARILEALKDETLIEDPEKLAQAANATVEQVTQVIRKIATLVGESDLQPETKVAEDSTSGTITTGKGTGVLAGTGTSGDTKPPETATGEGSASGTAVDVPFVGDSAALESFERRQAKLLSNKSTLDGLFENSDAAFEEPKFS